MHIEAIPIQSNWIANFREVSPGLYAGARPMLPGGIYELKSIGIKTIIDLEANNDPEYNEAVLAGAAGLTLHSMPLPGLEILTMPPADQMAAIALIVNDLSQRPLYVSCRHGSDRTGAVIGQYRVEQCDWTADEAIAEMRRFHNAEIEAGYRRWVQMCAEKKREADGCNRS